MEKIIGVLGGMGPEATLYFYRELIVQTPARTDQEHLRVIIDSNPKVPDRIQAILNGAESPVPAMAAGAAALERAGADFIVIPCISAHFFLEDLLERTNLPVLSIFDLVAEHIVENYPGVHTLGLLATTGTVQGGCFQERLNRLFLRNPPINSASHRQSAISKMSDPAAREKKSHWMFAPLRADLSKEELRG